MRGKFIGVLLCLIAGLTWLGAVQAGNAVTAVRLWPSPDYTRITLELAEAPQYKYFSLRGPERLVLDLRDVALGDLVKALGNQVGPGDPVIAGLRGGLNQPGVVRLVAELKRPAKAQVFTLKPMGQYGHRLVVDLYPAHAEAPLSQPPDLGRQVEAAIAEANKPAAPAIEKTSAAPATRAEMPAKSQFIRLVTVAIDAGHGGEDPGAIGANGSREKDITLSVARRLKAHIDRQENMRAVLIRDGDYFVPLHERVNKARRNQADLFVSVHADAFLKPTARGSSVFALSEQGATSAAARWLAKRENDADLIGGVNIDVNDINLKKTLISLSQDAQIRDSLVLAREVLDELAEVNQLHKPHVEQAGFAVLKAPDIPSILVETAFISNPDEEKRLLDEDYQERMAAAIATGIKRYFDRNPPLARTKVAQNL
ncbi:MAG: N-acetylmuramoyl-L-alanine amidase [Pseudomonadota bacterium]